MRRSEIEFRGRLMMIETLLGTTIAHMAALTTQPHLVVKQIMQDVEDNLLNGRKMSERDELECAHAAVAAFQPFSEAFMRHILKTAPPTGQG